MAVRLISNVLSALVCLLLAGLIVVVLTTDQSSATVSEKETKTEPRVLKVRASKVKTQDSFQVERTFNGVVKSGQMVDIGFSRGGTIKKTYVKPGDTVEKDKILAELDAGTDLKAPFKGIVSMKHSATGAVVNPGAPVYRIVDSADLEAWISIPVDVADRISTGDNFELRINDKSVTAKVEGLLPEVDPNGRTRTVIFNLPGDSSDKFVPGQTVQLVIKRNRKSPGFWVPLSALTKESRGLWSVYSVKEDPEKGQYAGRHFVEVIHVENSRAWVNGTVSKIDNIVTSGTHRIVPGQKVEAVDVKE